MAITAQRFTLLPAVGTARIETYFTVRKNGVASLNCGAYHYLPFENAIEFLRPIENYQDTLMKLLAEQCYFCDAPIVFFWACVAYRAEWGCANWLHNTIDIDKNKNLYRQTTNENRLITKFADSYIELLSQDDPDLCMSLFNDLVDDIARRPV